MGRSSKQRLPVISDKTANQVINRLQKGDPDKYLTEVFIKLKADNPQLVKALKNFLRDQALDPDEIKAALYGMLITNELFQQQTTQSRLTIKKPELGAAAKPVMLTLAASIMTYLATSLYGHNVQLAQADHSLVASQKPAQTRQICKPNDTLKVPCAITVVASPEPVTQTEEPAYAPVTIKKSTIYNTAPTPIQPAPTTTSTPEPSPPPPSNPPPSDPVPTPNPNPAPNPNLP